MYPSESVFKGGRASTVSIVVVSVAAVVVVVIVAATLLALRKNKGKGGDAPKAQRSRLSADLSSEADAREALAGDAPAMVFLYAEWCGFCKKAMPLYDELAKDPEHAGVKLLKLDASKAAGLAKEKGVTGFPTFLSNWGEGKYVGYKPKEQMKAILGASKKGGVRAAHAKAEMMESDVMAALEGKEPVVVFVSSESCGFCKRLAPLWAAAAAQPRKAKMIKIDANKARNLIKQHGITGFPTMISNKAEKKYIGYRPKEKLDEMLAAIEA